MGSIGHRQSKNIIKEPFQIPFGVKALPVEGLYRLAQFRPVYGHDKHYVFSVKYVLQQLQKFNRIFRTTPVEFIDHYYHRVI